MLFKRKLPLFLIVIAITAIAGGYILLQPPATTPAASGEKESHGDGEEEGHGEGKHIELTLEQIANSKLTIERAGPAQITVAMQLNGVIGPNEERTTQIVPRFEGVVRTIHKRLGDPVRRGEPLVTIESNDSLKNYDVTAPIDGTVIARSAALGEFAGTDKSLFVVADLSTVWGNFNVYRNDFDKVQTGQAIHVGSADANGNRSAATISYVSPLAIADTQSTIARAVLDNPNGQWRPGQFVAGDVAVSEQSAKVAVRRTALQTVENETVVFVQEGEDFEPRAVTLGASDDQMVEVLTGLSAGEAYVSTNSFVLKSELGKSSAEHSH